MKKVLSCLVLVGLIFSIVIPVSAQTADPDPLNITTSPLPISLTGKPGETTHTQLRVKNSGTKTETLKVGLMKFMAYGEEGKPLLQEREPGDDYFDWVSFSETQFEARPNEWKDLKMNIAIPKTAAFGYYYAVTFSRANPVASQDDKKTLVVGGTATLVLLEVQSKNAKRNVTLTSFSVNKKSYEFLPATFTIKLRNTGNVHAVPQGSIYITHGSKTIDVISVNGTKGNVLPGSGRIFSAEWKSGFPVYELKQADGSVALKNGKQQYQLSWKLSQLKNLRMGKYTAHLTMIYDDGTRDVPLDASVQFWVIPWRLLALVIGLPLLVLGVIIYLIISRRRFKKKAYGTMRLKR